MTWKALGMDSAAERSQLSPPPAPLHPFPFIRIVPDSYHVCVAL